MSDGEQAVAVMMASQYTHLIANSDIKELTVIDVVEYIKNMVNDKNVIILLNVAIIQQDVPKVGNPVIVSPNAPPGIQQHQQQAPAQNQALNQSYGAPNPQGASVHPQFGAPVGAPYGSKPPQQPIAQHVPMHGNVPQQTTAVQAHGNPASNTSAYNSMPNANAYGHTYPGTNAVPAGGHMQGIGGTKAASPLKPHYTGLTGSAIVRNEAPASIVPIASLNAYQNRWTIRARVTQKSDIRRYTNARGEGKFFSFDLLDADKGEIRVVGWNEQCDRFFDQVEEGRVYMISRASLRTKRGNFNQTRHAFEIHLESSTLIEPVQDEDVIPRINFNFVPLSQIEDTPQGNMVDVCTVVESVAEPMEITRKDGTQVLKRGVNVRDASGRSIELTLWDKYANNPGDKLATAVTGGHHPILAVRNARVGDFNGKTLSTVSSSQIMVDPSDLPEAAHLRRWFDQGGAAVAPQALSSRGALGAGRVDRRISISQIKDEQLGLGPEGKADWVQVVGQIMFIKSDTYSYPACPLQYNGRPCHKKLIDQTGTGEQWFCERCNQSVSGPEYRYIISAQLSDHTDVQWVTAFNEVGQDMMGLPAAQLKDWEQADDPNFSLTFQNIYGKEVTSKLKVSEDNYQDERRLRVTLMRVDPVDYVGETRRALEGIQKIEGGEHPFPPVQQPNQNESGAQHSYQNIGQYGGSSMAQPWMPDKGAMGGIYGGGHGVAMAPAPAFASHSGYGVPPSTMQGGYQTPGAGYINQGGPGW